MAARRNAQAPEQAQEPEQELEPAPVTAPPPGRLTARSVLASALLGCEPPELPVAYLVALAGLFGVNENRARVALSRMVAAGEATTDGAARYRLTGHLLERQERQRTSRAGATRPWRGDWHLVVMTAVGGAASQRRARRSVLQHARLAELREGVWTRPDNVAIHALRNAGDVVVMAARTPEGVDPATHAARLWDLEAWARRARELLAALRALEPAAYEDLAPGFELSAAVLRHLQADPLLPAELLPGDWPGRSLRESYDDWDGRYRALLRGWARSVPS